MRRGGSARCPRRACRRCCARSLTGGWPAWEMTRGRSSPSLSVIGQDVPLAVWGAAANADEETLVAVVERAVEAHLLGATEHAARFAHALYREALYEGLAPPRRRMLHRRVGEVLSALPVPAAFPPGRVRHASDPDAVAYHFQRAGDDPVIPSAHPGGGAGAARLCLADGGGALRGRRSSCWRGGRAMRGARMAAAAGGAGAPLLRLGAVGGGRRARRSWRKRRVIRCSPPTRDSPKGSAAASIGTGTWVWTRRVPRSACFEASFPLDAATIGPLERLGMATDLDHQRGSSARASAGRPICGRRARWVRESRRASRRPRAGCGSIAPSWGMPSMRWGLPGPRSVSRARRGRCTAVPRRPRGPSASTFSRPSSSGRQMLHYLALPYWADEGDRVERLADEIAAYAAKIREDLARVSRERRNRADSAAARALAQGDGLIADLRAAMLAGFPTTWAALGSARWRASRAMPTWPGRLCGRSSRWRGDHARVEAPHGDYATLASPRRSRSTPSTSPRREMAGGARPLVGLKWDRPWPFGGARALGRVPSRDGDAARAAARADLALAAASDPRQPLAMLAAQRLLGNSTPSPYDPPPPRNASTRRLPSPRACGGAPHERAVTLLARAQLQAARGDREGARAALDDVRALCRPLGAKRALDFGPMRLRRL